MKRMQIPRTLVAAALFSCACAMTPHTALAKNPYKSKEIPAQLARDMSIDPQRISNVKRGWCVVVPKDRYTAEQKLTMEFADCVAADLTNSYGIFVYDETEMRWKAEILITPDTARGVQVAETVSLGATLRQLVVELSDGYVLVVEYSGKGKLLGDNEHPVQILERLEAMGVARLPDARYVSHYVPPQPIVIYVP